MPSAPCSRPSRSIARRWTTRSRIASVGGASFPSFRPRPLPTYHAHLITSGLLPLSGLPTAQRSSYRSAVFLPLIDLTRSSDHSAVFLPLIDLPITDLPSPPWSSQHRLESIWRLCAVPSMASNRNSARIQQDSRKRLRAISADGLSTNVRLVSGLLISIRELPADGVVEMLSSNRHHLQEAVDELWSECECEMELEVLGSSQDGSALRFRKC